MPSSSSNVPSEPLVNSCPSCGQLLDVTELEPYSKIICRNCQDTIRVRTTFHHFQIREQIGVGGMSRVFRAEDTALKRDTALKILNRQCSNDTRRVAQFEREARITAAISHPNVVKVYSSGWDQGYFYIAMELVRGGSLDESIRKHKRLPEARVLDIAIETARGLKAAQQAGLIHRDIKPGNILFADDGTAKIVDFGLALMIKTDTDTDKELWATPYYVPPEKLNGGQEDHRSDIYSLGASLFHAVLGRPPCSSDSNSLEELRNIKNQTVNLTDEDAMLVSNETLALLECALQKDPADRYATYDDFIKHAEFARQHPTKGDPKSRRKKTGVNRPMAIAALVAAAAIGGGVSMLLKKSPTPSGDDPGLEIVSDPTASNNKTVSEQFIHARDSLFRGELPEAKQAFVDLAGNAPQPTGNWATFNAGLCALLQGDEPASRPIFAALKPYGDDPLSKFFQHMSSLLSSSEPVTGEQVKDLSSDSYNSIGLLATGLKNWQLGDWRKATGMLHKFQTAKLDSAGSWVQNYHALVAPHMEDLTHLKDWPKLRIEDLAGKEASEHLIKAKEIFAKLRLSGPVKDQCDKEIQRFTNQVDTLLAKEKAEREMKEAELIKQEIASFHKALDEASAASAGCKFSAAIERLTSEKFQSSQINEQLQDQLSLWKGAEEFLQLLTKELGSAPQEVEITRIDGSTQKGKIVSATREGIHFQIAGVSGEATIPFAQIQPNCLIRLAESPLDEDRVTDSDEYFRRRELIVAFALKSNLPVFGSLRGNELAREHRGFRDRWKRFQPQFNVD